MLKLEELRKTRVSLDCMDESFPCLLGDTTWNGWECPYFTLETIMNYLNKYYKRVNSFTWVVDDMTIVFNNDEGKFYEILDYCINELGYEVEVQDEAGFVWNYYSFGGFNWTWCEVKEGEE